MITHDTKSVSSEKQNMRALTLSFILLTVLALSLCSIFFFAKKYNEMLTARIYQGGELISTIDLSAVTESYSFQIEAKNGGFNIIEVRPGSIGIQDADCPDKLCVNMGYSASTLLPIVCLPHELVIEITAAAPANNTVTAPDIITY